MERPTKFEHNRWLGDKRSQVVYDVDNIDEPDVIDELMEAETFLCFGPDTLAEARNRGYTSRYKGDGSGDRLGLTPRCRRRTADADRAGAERAVVHPFRSGGVGIWRPPRPPRSAPRHVDARAWCSATASRPAGAAAGCRPVVPGAGRPHRHRAGLGRAGHLRFRGCGDSEGDFSLGGWLADLAAAVGLPARPRGGRTRCGWPASAPAARWPCAPRRARPTGCGAWPPWARRPTSTTGPSHPRRLLLHARDVGIIRSASFPPVVRRVVARAAARSGPSACGAAARPAAAARLHGSDDESVPVFDARVLADAHGDADLRIIDGAGHQLRHDPRAVAVLLGWLDRQRNQAAQRRRLTGAAPTVSRPCPCPRPSAPS